MLVSRSDLVLEAFHSFYILSYRVLQAGVYLIFEVFLTSGALLFLPFRAEKTMTATDVTGFDAIFSTGFFATFSRF